MHEELLRLEDDFARAIIANDAVALGPILDENWIIVDPDGSIIDRARFLNVIGSGALTHETMESDDVKIHTYNDMAVVTARTTTRGKFMGNEFTSVERATDIFSRNEGQWRCVFSQLTRIAKKQE